jgi:23S rRNA (uracil1939-C5)-methyltransferase
MNPSIFENVEILDAGSEGKAIARVNDLVIFVPFVVPGDIVDIQVTRKRKNYREGKAVKFHRYSEKRQEAFCSHFGTCGGCRWQNMQYPEQLKYKQKQVEDNILRIAKIEQATILPIIPSENDRFYRNKLEYTFSNHRWLTDGDKQNSDILTDTNALGFHIPTMFDKVLDIERCYLQADPSNAIRLEAKRYAVEQGLSFYDVRIWQGFLRNLVIRCSGSGEWMIIMVFRTYEETIIKGFLDNILAKFPVITSMYYVINDKKNDVITDLPYQLYYGRPYITEPMLDYNGIRELKFRIGPSSFFQTNSKQAKVLYRAAGDFAGFTGNETVYDLYTGIGSIAGFIAGSVKKVVGIESIPAAVEDAKENARLNGVTNTVFFAGETEKVLDPSFFSANGNPDIIITDPPRAGMHEKVVKAMMEAAPEKIVYVSCNPATQARDILLLKEKYSLVKCQPVDMFPHTQHVENIALLTRI